MPAGEDQVGGPPIAVLQVAPRLCHGCPESFAVDLALTARAAGGRSLVASAGGDLAEPLRAAEIPLHPMPVDGGRGNESRLARLIRRERVDVVHAHGVAGLDAVPAARRCGVPAMLGLHHLPEDGRLRERLIGCAAAADFVLFGSEAVAEAVAGAVRIEPARMGTLRPGVDLSRFDPERVPADRIIRLARQWHLPDEARIVLAPAALRPGEGHELLIEALALLDASDLHAVLMGCEDDGPAALDRLLALADVRGLGARVCLVEECRQRPAAQMLADVVVVASPRPEVAAAAVAEALAMGRPLVAVENAGVEGLFGDAPVAWLVPPEEPRVLAQAVAEALALTAAERAVLGARAIEEARARFDRAVACTAVLSLYESLLEDGASGRRAAAARPV
ncbi:MAG: glycosyltransferase [Rhodospirillaceae bacterium]|nr:glycosyltransferase [Rhodospirillaceae bacterium]